MLFTTRDGKTPIANPLHVHAALGSEPQGKRIYLTGAGEKFADISISSNNPLSVSASVVKTPYNGPLGMWTVDLQIGKPGDAAILAHRGAEFAILGVKVDDRVVLPVIEPFAMLAKLLLAENPTPEDAGYSLSEVVVSMQWMRIVLENPRRDPQKFYAANGTLEAIVQAPGQFAGFGSYPLILKKQQDRLLTILNRVNDDGHPKQAAYGQLVACAINMAVLPPVHDPCPTGLYGWRTARSSAPGGDLVEWQRKAGNQFYTLQSKKTK